MKIALSLVRRLTPFVRQFDFALDWRYRKAGKVLFEEGDSCLGLYIVLHGRLRSFHRNSSSSYSTASDMNVNSLSWSIGAGGAGFVEEFARGDSVGEIDLLTESNHSSTVIAIRDTEVCQIPRSLFNMIVKRYPFVMAHFARAMYKRIGGSLKRLNTSSAPSIHEKFSFSALAPVKKRPAGDGSNDGTAAAPTPGTSTPTSTPTSTTSTSVFSSTSAASSATTTATATAAGVGSSASAVLEATKASSTPTTTTTSSATTTTTTATATTNIPPALAPFVSTTSGAHGLATIAVIGASENVPLHAFTARLVACLSKLGQTLHLNNQIVVSHFATNSVTRLDKIRLTSWLGRLEEENDVVVYEAENSASSWTKRCIRQVSVIIFFFLILALYYFHLI